MRLTPLFIPLLQQFLCPALDLVLQELQAGGREVVAGMFFEVEVQKMAQAFFMGRGEDFFCGSDKIIVDGRQKRIGIVGQRLI